MLSSKYKEGKTYEKQIKKRR